jgi:hypothetical protein
MKVIGLIFNGPVISPWAGKKSTFSNFTPLLWRCLAKVPDWIPQTTLLAVSTARITAKTGFDSKSTPGRFDCLTLHIGDTRRSLLSRKPRIGRQFLILKEHQGTDIFLLECLYLRKGLMGEAS